jgi:hypothetical protein
MTDRHAGYVVTLANDVLSVEPITGGFDVHIAEQRVRAEVRDKLLVVLREI